MNLPEALHTIGLNEKQAAVYTALLQLGQASAYAIAQKSGLKKPTTYVILEELIEKGLAMKLARTKVQQYAAISPEMAFGLAEERLEQAKRKLPELLAITKGEKTKVSAVYFEGVEGIKKLAEYRVKDFAGEEVLGFWAVEPENKELIRYFHEDFPGVFQRNRIKMRGIVPEHENLTYYRERDQRYGRTMKSVPPKQFSSEVAVEVLGDVVRISDYKNLQGIAIDNKDVAKTMKEIFEMLWQRVE